MTAINSILMTTLGRCAMATDKEAEALARIHAFLIDSCSVENGGETIERDSPPNADRQPADGDEHREVRQ